MRTIFGQSSQILWRVKGFMFKATNANTNITLNRVSDHEPLTYQYGPIIGMEMCDTRLHKTSKFQSNQRWWGLTRPNINVCMLISKNMWTMVQIWFKFVIKVGMVRVCIVLGGSVWARITPTLRCVVVRVKDPPSTSVLTPYKES